MKSPPISHIVQAAAAVTGVPADEIIGVRRQADIAFARALAIYVATQRRQDLSLPRIGRAFDRDHSTICYARRRVQALVDRRCEQTLEDLARIDRLLAGGVPDWMPPAKVHEPRRRV